LRGFAAGAGLLKIYRGWLQIPRTELSQPEQDFGIAATRSVLLSTAQSEHAVRDCSASFLTLPAVGAPSLPPLHNHRRVRDTPTPQKASPCSHLSRSELPNNNGVFARRRDPISTDFLSSCVMVMMQSSELRCCRRPHSHPRQGFVVGSTN
jgi:hypothetical protein